MGDDDVINLQTDDNKIYQVYYKHIKLSKTVFNVIEDAGIEQIIPVLGVTGKMLENAIEYCKTPEDKDRWIKQLAELSLQQLCEMIHTANKLDIGDLLDMSTDTMVNHIKGKTPEQLRAFFGITEVATEEQEAEMKEEWNLEGQQ